MKFYHMFLGEVTLADPSLNQAVADRVGTETFVEVIDAQGERSTAKVRTLEPIQEIEIPETHRSLNTLADEVHGIAVSKGWYPADEKRPIPELLFLAVGELAEAGEEIRMGRNPHDVFTGPKGGPEGFSIEIADTIIRILDMCAYLDIDIDAAVRTKIEYNKTRPHRHGGKKF